MNRLRIRRSLLVTLALAVALAGCARMLPTSPGDAGAPAPAAGAAARPAATPAATLPGTIGDLTGGIVTTLGRLIANPLFILDPSQPIQIGPLHFNLLVLKVVDPLVDTTVRGGRWTLDLHRGSLLVPTPVSISTASDGTMRVQFGPDGTRFGVPVDLTIDYSGTALDPSSPSYVPGLQPQFLYYDPAQQGWVELPSVNDPAHRLLHAKLQHFSTYAVGGRAGW